MEVQTTEKDMQVVQDKGKNTTETSAAIQENTIFLNRRKTKGFRQLLKRPLKGKEIVKYT